MLLPAFAVTFILAASDAGTERPLEYARPITTADLEGRTLRELSLMRNVIFARAGQPFRKEWLRDHFTHQPWYQPTGFDGKKVTALGRANARAIVEYELKLPQAELLKRLKAQVAPGPDESKTGAGKARLVEMQLLAQATGSKLPGAWYTAAPSVLQHDALIDPDLLKSPLSLDDLSNLSRRDLRLLRNTVFARHGRVFQTLTMREWFSRMVWYQEDPKYSDQRLTRVDRENIKLIRSVEESIGGAETEEEALAARRDEAGAPSPDEVNFFGA